MEYVDEYEYNKKDIIGHGAFAIVFRGRERKRPDQTVAIKCINKKNLSKSQTFPEKEIEILKELHHENVVSLHHFKETASSLFMVMEFCNGGDLADYLHIKGTLSEDTIRFFLGQIAAAMKAIHEKGIIHRDLKPQNLLLSHNSRHKVPHPNEIHLKIADFGFARFLEGDMMAATLCGSPLYMAPEVITSQHYDAKADLWSIGTIIFQCLTGSAPFKAPNPPELKKLYLKARTLDPNIPPGTSRALKDLLIRLLKRNQKDRIEFDAFFNHDFLSKTLKSTSTSPMPVPSRTYSFSSDSPGERRSLSVSPLSGHMPISSPEEPSPSRATRDYSPATPSRPLAAKGLQDKLSSGMGSSDLVEDDFVIVQPGLVSELSYETSGASVNVQTTTDVITIRSHSSPIMSSSRCRPSTSPGSTATTAVRRKLPSPSERPSSLPISSSPSTSPNSGRHRVSPKQSPSSLISPSKIHAQIRHSYSSSGGSPIGSPSQRRRLLSPNQSPSLARHCILAQTGGMDYKPSSPVQATGLSSPGSQYNPGVVHKFYKFHASPTSSSPSPPHIPRVSTEPSMSPQGAGLYRGSSPQGTSPTNIPSPARRKLSSPAKSSPQFFTGPSSLPTIAGSPTKKGFGNEITFTIGSHGISPSEPLNMPFAKSRRVRASSCCLDGQDMSDSPGQDAIIPRSASSSRLTEPLCLKAAFDNLAMNPAGSIEGIPGAIGASPPTHPTSFFIGSQSRRSSVLTEGSPSSQSSLTFATSPPNMEGPISFVAPELPEETLLAPEHTETVDRLNVILGIVEAIVEVAKSRSIPLAESVYNQGSSIFSNSQVCFVSENYRLAEQLVLYTRSLELLNAALTMAKEEFSAGRLKPSNAVRMVLQELNRVYHLCLTKSRQFCEGSPLQSLDIDLNSAMITADKLMYSYAIEQCQSAGMDEMFGNSQECLQRYRTAQMLLHGLCLQAGTDHDRNLLLKFKNALDQRLLFLERQQTPVTPMIGHL